jgi:hypothetical protein
MISPDLDREVVQRRLAYAVCQEWGAQWSSICNAPTNRRDGDEFGGTRACLQERVRRLEKHKRANSIYSEVLGHGLCRRLEYGSGRKSNSCIGNDDVQTTCDALDLSHSSLVVGLVARSELYDLHLVGMFSSKCFKGGSRVAGAGEDKDVVALRESAGESETWSF